MLLLSIYLSNHLFLSIVNNAFLWTLYIYCSACGNLLVNNHLLQLINKSRPVENYILIFINLDMGCTTRMYN